MATRPAANVVDSSAWLSWFADEPAAGTFAEPIEDTRRLVVPSVCILEVFKVVLRERGQDDALQCAALMTRGLVVALDGALPLSAARLGLEHKLPLADSVVYATAEAARALLWTQDEHFEGLPNVRYVKRRS